MLSPESVVNPTLCTKVTNRAGVRVVVVEHLLAALKICGITNALIELDSEEVPIMDGSAAVFVKELQKAKIIQQNSFVPAVVIKQPVVVKSKNGSISLTPNDNCEISVEISYDRIDPVIGSNNAYSFTFDNDDTLDDIANSRTFGWFEDCEKIKNMGLALGASEENTIAILKDNSIKNEGGLRNPKELVMHKCLDLIGDISVLGYDIIGKINCVNPSHSLNNILIKTLANDFSCHQIVTSRNIGRTNGSAQIQKHMRQKNKKPITLFTSACESQRLAP
jgi:UDP-3-O-[3-hydroxymyristoyl] N-acetylglucosamine deacetylase